MNPTEPCLVPGAVSVIEGYPVIDYTLHAPMDYTRPYHPIQNSVQIHIKEMRKPGLDGRPLSYTASSSVLPKGVSLTQFLEADAPPASLPRQQKSASNCLLYLQGGPGFPSPRPAANCILAWQRRACRDFRVLLLDQRGTGLSTPTIGPQALASLSSPEAQAKVCSFFRADSIVKDCELLRLFFANDASTWSLLGQSFGGFVATSYVLRYPHNLYCVYLTGGIPPVLKTADDVYIALFVRVKKRNVEYYRRYPDDVELVAKLANVLQQQCSHSNNQARLPHSGSQITPRMLSLLGIHFGFFGGYDRVHHVLRQAFVPAKLSYAGDDINALVTSADDGQIISEFFLREFETMVSFEGHPIYALLHESIYCTGAFNSKKSMWAADRVLRQFYPEFLNTHVLGPPATATKDSVPYFLFAGEMVFPWFFDDFASLKPLKKCAEILAATEWPQSLYGPENFELASSSALQQVNLAAAVYYDDMYVERQFSIETAELLFSKCNSNKGAQLLISNEWDHGGLRADGEKILERLIGLVCGVYEPK